jgi:hypothetical protein
MKFFKKVNVEELIKFLKESRVQKFSGCGIEVEFFPDYEAVMKQQPPPTAEQLKYFATEMN